MKTKLQQRLFFITCVTVFLINSCSNDIDDTLNAVFKNQIEGKVLNQFKSSDGIMYSTGCADCLDDGSYTFDENNLISNLLIPDSLPHRYDLSDLLPPVGNQGRQGSCTSWAITYYMKSMQEKIKSGLNYTADNIMSPAYTYNQLSQGICEGTSLPATLNVLLDKGSVSLSSFPYYDYTCSRQPSLEQDSLAVNHKISDYKYLSGINMVPEMKTLITDSIPVIISAFLTPEFGITDEFGVSAYREHSRDFDEEGACHAMLVVGYDDLYNAFKVVNSWGENWGNDGFVWIDYKAFENVLEETAVFKVISSAMVAYNE